MLGSCTGLLSAAAATACTPCTTDWIPLAVQVVCIAFRIGLHTSSVANSLAHNDGSHKSWSSIIQGKLAAETLAEFHGNMVCLPALPMDEYAWELIMLMRPKNIPLSHQAYVSAITPTTTTISGPPHTLRKFFDSATFGATGCSALSIPVFAPYHAGHLHQAADIDWIIGADDPYTSQLLGCYKSISVLLSTKTGKPFVPTDMTSLFKSVVNEILNDILRWDTILAEATALVPSQCEVTAIVIGSPGLGKSLVSALNVDGTCKASLQSASEILGKESYEHQEHSIAQRSKIAIIGMSGRFPGAKDTEELWRILCQGLDVHKEVCYHGEMVKT